MQIPVQEISLNTAVPLQYVLSASGGFRALGYKLLYNANHLLLIQETVLIYLFRA